MGYIAKIIAKTLTIRGVGKIGNTQSTFIKSIWTAFVISMTSLLIYATVKLTQEFLSYDLVIRISIKSNDHSTEFPTLSFCHHNPFGPRAHEHWNKSEIMSPTKFNKKIRDSMKNFLKEDPYLAYNIFKNDKRSIYYQHLKTEETEKLGWNINDTFIICSIYQGSFMEINVKSECSIKVIQFSLPQYLNCFSVTPIDTNPKNRMTMMALLLKVSSLHNGTFEYHKGFVSGILDQQSGLRAIVHEKNTFPDIENEGFNLEQGKLVEVNFDVIRKIKLKTPKQPCSNDNREDVTDLDQSFKFTQRACYRQIKGRSILDSCKCFYSDTLRPGLPNSTHPYCGHIINITLDELGERFTCLKNWTSTFDKKTKEIFLNECKPRCIRYDYDLSLSVTKWLPTSWQLSWLLEIDSANINYIRSKSIEEKQFWKEKILTYINSKDIVSNPNSENYIEQDNFVMVMVRRRNFDTTEQREKLTLDLYNLLSRFGGLCSLCLGLTCAFIMEIFEVIYLLIQEKKVKIKEDKNLETVILCNNIGNIQLQTNGNESPIWLSSI